MFTYWGLMGNPLIHLETERNNRIDQNEFQSINSQFENTGRGIIAPRNFSAGGTLHQVSIARGGDLVVG
jgi:hypothetical protein